MEPNQVTPPAIPTVTPPISPAPLPIQPPVSSVTQMSVPVPVQAVPPVQAPQPVTFTEMPILCPQCHQLQPANAYFCSNCGKNLHEAPLPTTVGAQVGLYAFSIALPMICFLFAGKWKGIKYAKSHDPKAKTMGFIAIALIIVSTGVLMWLTIVWVDQAIQSQINSINLDGLD